MRDRLQGIAEDYDLIVIGGGINGAGVARDAALRGLRVALLEKDDFASGSSSKTSKLAHGGLRYLEHGALRLVWEACHERQLLLRLAPHLVWPLPFVFPVYRGSRVGRWRLHAGMWLYDLMAGFRNVTRHRMLSRRDLESWRNGLRRDGLRAAALYYDASMDDARLVLANVIGARDAGATTLNGVEVRQLQVKKGVITGVEARERLSGRSLVLRAPYVVSCAGPWTNHLLGQLPGAPQPLRPTRGTHIVTRRLSDQAFTLAAERDGRIFFVLPWMGLTLIGTTDVDDSGDADRVSPSDAEVDYLLGEAQRFFPEAALVRGDVLSAFAGLRPLLRAGGAASARSREHVVLEPLPGLLAMAGGKFTTYRAVAESIVDRIEKRLGRRTACRTGHVPLPGGDVPWPAAEQWSSGPRVTAAVEACARRAGIPLEAARLLYATYGSHADRVAALVEAESALGAPLCAHHPHLRAQALYAARSEMALHLEDFFLRRTRLAYSACHGLDGLEATADLFARELGWSATQRLDEMQSCRRALESVVVSRSPASSHAG